MHKCPYSTPTLTSKGGVAIYVNSDFKTHERTDLKVQTKDYESVWVEISNNKSKNIVCGCIYRHPRYQQADFLEYMDSTLHKITKENKEIYLCGDFNIDFLQTVNLFQSNLQAVNFLHTTFQMRQKYVSSDIN